jgi:hypothetical protein
MNYNFVTTVKSESNPDKEYTIKMKEDGLLSCSCPSWIFNQRHNRTCKHIDTIIKAGFAADKQGKFITVTDRWGYKSPLFCKNYGDGCDSCNLKFLCYTEVKPEFDREALEKAGVVKKDTGRVIWKLR